MVIMRKWIMTLVETNTDTGKTIIVKEFIKSAKTSEIKKTRVSKKENYKNRREQVKSLKEINLTEGGF